MPTIETYNKIYIQLLEQSVSQCWQQSFQSADCSTCVVIVLESLDFNCYLNELKTYGLCELSHAALLTLFCFKVLESY